MSTVIAKNVQIGTSGTATDNFTIFQPATPDGTLRIGNGNTGITTSQVALTSAGNFGIGTNAPVSKLHIESTSAESLQIGYSSTKRGRLGATSAGDLQVYAYETGVGYRNILLATDAGSAAGNVGIGTSSPGNRLDVSTSTSGAVARFSGNGDAFIQTGSSGTATNNYHFGSNYSGSFVIYQGNYGSGTERMRIDSSGNVGIGTSAPAFKLELSGSFYQRDAYAILGNFNAGTSGTSPSSNAGFAIATNITGGQAETDLWNTLDPALYPNTGLLFTQRLTSSTRRDLMFLHNNGNLQFNSGYGSVATAYGCRAWVNFNGTGTVAIRASGNVSSITDIGTGTYDVNYAIALSANMCPVALCTDDGISNRAINLQGTDSSNNLTSRCRVTIWQSSGGSADSTGVYVAVFR